MTESFKEIKLIASDMDGTLLSDQGELPKELKSYVDDLQDQGVIFGIASGKPYYALEAVFKDRIKEMALVCSGGTFVSYEEETIYNSTISQSAYRELISLIKGASKGIPALIANDKAYFDSQAKPYYNDFSDYVKIEFVDDLGQVEAEVNKVTAYFPDYDNKDYLQENQEQISGPYTDMPSGAKWIDITMEGQSKGHGLDKLLEKLNYSPSELVVIGDSGNDTEMLSLTPHSFAMKNASDQVKSYANYTTSQSNNDQGVLEVYKKVLAARKESK